MGGARRRDPAGKWENLPSGKLTTCPALVRGIFVADASVGGQFGQAAGLLDKTPVRRRDRGQHVQERPVPRSRVSARGRVVPGSASTTCSRVGGVSIGTNVGILSPTGELVADQNLPGLHIVFGSAVARPDRGGVVHARAAADDLRARGRRSRRRAPSARWPLHGYMSAVSAAPSRRSFGVLLEIAYDGTAYAGWAPQEGRATVHAVVTGAIHALDPRASLPRGTSRTDAGVHADGQLAAFDASLAIPPRGWVLALNQHLPDDVCVRSAAQRPRRVQPALRRAREALPLPGPARPDPRPALDEPRLAHRLAGRPRAARSRGASLRGDARLRRLPLVARRAERYGEDDDARRGRSRAKTRASSRIVDRGARRSSTTWCGSWSARSSTSRAESSREDAVMRALEGKERRLAGTTAPAHGLTLESSRRRASRKERVSHGRAEQGERHPRCAPRAPGEGRAVAGLWRELWDAHEAWGGYPGSHDERVYAQLAGRLEEDARVRAGQPVLGRHVHLIATWRGEVAGQVEGWFERHGVDGATPYTCEVRSLIVRSHDARRPALGRALLDELAQTARRMGRGVAGRPRGGGARAEPGARVLREVRLHARLVQPADRHLARRRRAGGRARNGGARSPTRATRSPSRCSSRRSPRGGARRATCASIGRARSTRPSSGASPAHLARASVGRAVGARRGRRARRRARIGDPRRRAPRASVPPREARHPRAVRDRSGVRSDARASRRSSRSARAWPRRAARRRWSSPISPPRDAALRGGARDGRAPLVAGRRATDRRAELVR